MVIDTKTLLREIKNIKQGRTPRNIRFRFKFHEPKENYFRIDSALLRERVRNKVRNFLRLLSQPSPNPILYQKQVEIRKAFIKEFKEFL